MPNVPDITPKLDALHHRVQAIEGLTRQVDAVLSFGPSAAPPLSGSDQSG
jgi:hypothetical protein